MWFCHWERLSFDLDMLNEELEGDVVDPDHDGALQEV